MIEEKRPNKKTLIILLIAIFVISFGLGIVFDKMVLMKGACEAGEREEPKKPEEPKEPEKPEEVQEGGDKQPTQPTQPNQGQQGGGQPIQPTQPSQPGSGERLSKKETIIQIYKEEAKKKGLYKESDIKDITYNVKYVGYIKDAPNIKYYTVYGKFKCNSGYTCVYQEQIGEQDANGYYDWAMTLKFDETNGRFDYKEMGSYSLSTNSNAVMVNQELH